MNQLKNLNLEKLKNLCQQRQSKNEPAKLTEPIVGLRVWRVATEGGLPKLQSAAYLQFIWPYRKAMQIDPIQNLGIHAIRLGGAITGLFQTYVPERGVAGEVYLWGKVTECAYGYLAEYAYPKRLFCPPEMDVVTIMQLEEEYGVPCEIREEFSRPKQPEIPQQQHQGVQLYPASHYYQTLPTLPIPTIVTTPFYTVQTIGISQANSGGSGFFQGVLGGIAGAQYQGPYKP